MNKRLHRIKRLLCVTMTLLFLAMPCASFAAEKKGSLQILVKNNSSQPVSGIQMYLYPVASPDGTLNSDFAATGIPKSSLLLESHNKNNAKVLYNHAVSKNISGEKRTTPTDGTVHYTSLEKGIYLVGIPDKQGIDFNPFLVKIPTMINGTAEYYLKATPKVVVPGGGGGGGGTKPEPEEPEVPDVPEVPDTPVTPDEPVDPGVDIVDPDTPTGDNELKDPAIDIFDPDVPNSNNKLDDPTLDIFDPNVPSYLLQIGDNLIPQTGALRFPIWILNAFGGLFILIGAAQLHKAAKEEEELDDEES